MLMIPVLVHAIIVVRLVILPVLARKLKMVVMKKQKVLAILVEKKGTMPENVVLTTISQHVLHVGRLATSLETVGTSQAGETMVAKIVLNVEAEGTLQENADLAEGVNYVISVVSKVILPVSALSQQMFVIAVKAQNI